MFVTSLRTIEDGSRPRMRCKQSCNQLQHYYERSERSHGPDQSVEGQGGEAYDIGCTPCVKCRPKYNATTLDGWKRVKTVAATRRASDVFRRCLQVEKSAPRALVFASSIWVQLQG